MVAPKATAVFLMMAMMMVSFADGELLGCCCDRPPKHGQQQQTDCRPPCPPAARQLKQGPSSEGFCAAFASAIAVAVSTGGTAVSQAQAVANAVCNGLRTGSGVAEAIAQAASSGNANTAAQAIAEAASGGGSARGQHSQHKRRLQDGSAQPMHADMLGHAEGQHSALCAQLASRTSAQPVSQAHAAVLLSTCCLQVLPRPTHRLSPKLSSRP